MVGIWLPLLMSATPEPVDIDALQSRLVFVDQSLSQTDEGWGAGPTAMAVIGFGVGPLALGGGLAALGWSANRPERVLAGVSLVSLACTLVVGAVTAMAFGNERMLQRHRWLEEKSSLENQLEEAGAVPAPQNPKLVPSLSLVLLHYIRPS
jgi:hypothetical protein